MNLIIASNNANKVREIKQILGERFANILTLKDAGINVDVEETGSTFLENAYIKAAEIMKIAPKGYAVLSDDSGLEVDYLNGAPGVFSARYAGEGHNDKLNNEKLLSELQGVEDQARTARFVCAMVLLSDDFPPIEVVGACEGRILHEPKGESGFGYDPLFYYPPLQKSFAELTAEEKNKVSHRSRALQMVRAELEKKLNQR
jgi:XTP/dITP diphosphohydrolase